MSKLDEEISRADEANGIYDNIDSNRLQSIVERIERLNQEKEAISADIRDIFAEAKSAGFDNKILRAVIRLRKMNAKDRDEQEALIDIYKRALGI